MNLNRRRFVGASLAAAASTPGWAQGEVWSGGRIALLLPVADHERLRLKVVFTDPPAQPVLRIARRNVPGMRTDTAGRAFVFDADALEPSTSYELELRDGGRRLSDPWSIRTLPAPDTEPEHLRLLVFTCAGGHPLMSEGENSTFLPIDIRRRLLARGLTFAPDAVIANGDHVYWDQRTSLESGNAERAALSRRLYEATGQLLRDEPADSPTNAAVLRVVAGEQIAPLYTSLLRSVPTYFINDDHDYFENDEATDRFVTLPPYRYQSDFAAHVRRIYLPEFLAAPTEGALSGGTAGGINPSFGTLRWGRLCEVLMYDCAGYLSLKGSVAGLVPPEVESWLLRRTGDSSVRQLIHMPSHPFGWSAGKWREWYPDVADTGAEGAQTAQMGVAGAKFELTTDKPKHMWQSGWWQQHQRLLAALAAQDERPALVVSGDLHATGHARILRSADRDFSANPVNAIITGTLGTGTVWPSRERGTLPVPATRLELESPAPIAEKNGFTILDVSPDEVRVRLFAWRRETATVDAIDSLTPYHDVQIRRGG